MVEVFGLPNRRVNALQEAPAKSSGGSFILQAIGRQITLEIADHIDKLNLKGILEFACAMEQKGLSAEAIVEWAKLGLEHFLELASRPTSK